MSLHDRPTRSDATRNRGLLLAAAEQEFAERGMTASVADIARRAGVAKGTVFRHFASKEDLVAAIVCNHFDELTVVAGRLLDSPDPGAALLEFMIVAVEGLQQHDLAFLHMSTEGDSTVAEMRSRLHASVDLLVDRARTASAVRDDLTGTDVLLLLCAPIHAIASLKNPPIDLWRRYLVIIFDGLRPQGASPLPAPAPTWP